MTAYNKDITVIIADDHDFFRDGLALLLQKEPGIQLMGEVSNGQAMVSLAKRLKPDIILADLKMPVQTGVEAMKEITAMKLPSACIALTNFDNDNLVMDAFGAGAKGYLQKSSGRQDTLDAVRAVHAGGNYYCRTTSARLAAIIARSGFHRGTQIPPIVFSAREKLIIQMICEEHTNEEIGKSLFASPRTIERTRAGIMEKIGAKTPAGVVIYALRNNLYFLD